MTPLPIYQTARRHIAEYDNTRCTVEQADHIALEPPTA
jgi:hypothetical protein